MSASLPRRDNRPHLWLGAGDLWLFDKQQASHHSRPRTPPLAFVPLCLLCSCPPPTWLLRRSSQADRAGRTRRRLCHYFLFDKEVNVPGRGRALTGSRRHFIVRLTRRRRHRRGVTSTPALYPPLNGAKLAAGWICHHERDAARAHRLRFSGVTSDLDRKVCLLGSFCSFSPEV